MQKIIKVKKSSFVLFVFSLVFSAMSWGVSFDRAAISLISSQSQIDLDVEFAQSFEQRARGLMFRESLCGNCGMLFQYEQPQTASMWMKNTLIPLDVAFVTKKGVIADILSMKPHDLTSISSSKKVLFALEMNQGWFASNNIKVGDKLVFVKPAN